MGRRALHVRKPVAAFVVCICICAGIGSVSVSCMSRHESASADVNPAGWRGPVVATYANTDTLSLRTAAIVLRHGPEAEPADGAYVVEAASPRGAKTRDTIKIALPSDPSGNDLQEVRIPFRTHVRFGEAGDYVFTFTPLQNVRGVWSVAIDFQPESRQE